MFLFNIFPYIFMIIFGLFMVIFVMAILKGFKQWNTNNHSAKLPVLATVKGKRMDVHHRAHDDSMHHSSTYYYVTFEVESKDRLEFLVSGNEYGLLIEGDYGKLTFQGTRYLGFSREY